MCKQFLKRQIVTDVAGLIIFKNKQVLYTVSTEVEIFIEILDYLKLNIVNLYSPSSRS